MVRVQGGVAAVGSPSTPVPMPKVARFAHLFLLIGFGGQVLFGHLVAFGLGSPLMAWHQDRVGLALWGHAAFGSEAAAYQTWAAGLIGGTIISYAWAMLWLTAVPLRRGERWAAWAIAIATSNWCVVDTAISLVGKVWVNVIFNLVALSSVMIPLALMVPWLREASAE